MRFEVSLRCVEGLFVLRDGGWHKCCSRRRRRVTPSRGFSHVELAARMWMLRRVGGLEATSNIEGCGWAFLVAAAVLVCVPEKTQSGSPYAAEPPQAARPNHLTAVYRLLQCGGRQSPRASGRQGPDRSRLASPIQHTPPVLLYFRRLLDVFTERLHTVTRGGWLKLEASEAH